MREKDYQCRLKVVNYELKGRVLGLIGLGNIGRRVAQICVNGFGMKAIGYDPYMTNDMLSKNMAPVELCGSIDEVIGQADIVSLHAPGSEKPIISARELDIMKPGSVLINTARGNLVDENALYDALISNKLMGAGLDVTDKEPPDPENPLFELDNVVATPHTAALTEEGNRNMAVGAASQVLDVLSGRKPWGFANPEIWEQRRQ
jgi:D-3-phosphoglycerate dehydrogenase